AEAEQVEGADSTTEDPEAEAALQALAEEEGYDLNDPSQRGFVEKMLARDKRRASQESEEEALTDFEKEVFGQTEEPEQTEHPQQQVRQEQRQPQQQANSSSFISQIRDRGTKWNADTWREDSLKDELQALGRIGDDIDAKRNPDYRDLLEIRDARD